VGLDPPYEAADHADEGEVVKRENLVAGRDRARLLQRRLLIGIALATLLTWALVIADLERGGRPDPPRLRAAAILLDGPWRFRTGDDPRWADASADDRNWETIDLTAAPGSHDGDVGLPDYLGGWMAHGHPGHTGYAWYRRGVTVPAGRASWDVLGPTLVEDGYEIYWNGRLLGGSGKLGPHPRVVGTRPLRFALPAGAAGTRGVLALRAFMLPRPAPSADGGGLHSPPILAPRPVSDGLTARNGSGPSPVTSSMRSSRLRCWRSLAWRSGAGRVAVPGAS
jgi:hypothetical protein